jgi:uncharacterized secreted protein with C-terminal beta-propeller domain
MSIFDQMIQEAERANREEDLPDEIMNKITHISENREDFSEKEDLIEELIERLEDYEPFADVGCGNESYSTADVQRTVDKILSK